MKYRRVGRLEARAERILAICSILGALGAMAFGTSLASAASSAEKFTCKAVSFPRTSDNSVFVRRNRSAPRISCKSARSVLARFGKRGRVTGWSCKRGRTGLGLTAASCRRSGYYLALIDLSLTFAQKYTRSTETISFDYGAELNRLGHRICVFYNQPPSSNTPVYNGQRAENEDQYTLMRILLDQYVDYPIPSAEEQRQCPESAPVAAEAIYPLRYKGALAAEGECAVNRAARTANSVSAHAYYSECARNYTRYREEALRVKPDSDAVGFTTFLKKMGVANPPPVMEEPPAEDPPPCVRERRPCG